MSNASVGLVALWTGELCANVEYIRTMAIHKMNDAELDQFQTHLRAATNALASLTKYITDQQEQP